MINFFKLLLFNDKAYGVLEMSNGKKTTFKRIDIRRLVSLHDDVDKPAPAYEFGRGVTIYQNPQAPGQSYRNSFIREKDIDSSFR